MVLLIKIVYNKGGLFMSLNVYLTRDEVPKNLAFIEVNDIYFNGYTKIGNSNFEANVLSAIDNIHLSKIKEILERGVYIE